MVPSQPPPESKFAYVIVASRRARQLQAGARPLVQYPKSCKPTRIAQQELEAGLLDFEVAEIADEGEEKAGKRRKG